MQEHSYKRGNCVRTTGFTPSFAVQLGNIWEQLVREHVHSISLGAPTGVRINFQKLLPRENVPTALVQLWAAFLGHALTEVFNARDAMLGVEGLEVLMRKSADKPLAEMKQSILDGVAAWKDGPLVDDLSLVVVEVR